MKHHRRKSDKVGSPILKRTWFDKWFTEQKLKHPTDCDKMYAARGAVKAFGMITAALVNMPQTKDMEILYQQIREIEGEVLSSQFSYADDELV